VCFIENTKHYAAKKKMHTVGQTYRKGTYFSCISFPLNNSGKYTGNLLWH